MSGMDEQRQRLEEKARIRNAQVSQKKRWTLPRLTRPKHKTQGKHVALDNSKATTLEDNHTQSASVMIKSTARLVTSKLGVALISALVAAGATYYYTEDYHTEETQAVDSLNNEAGGGSHTPVEKKKKNTKIVPNDNVYPNPPDQAMDRLPPANVAALPPVTVRSSTSLALGDSTVSWSDGEKLDSPLVTCGVDKGTWADRLHIANISCPGKTISQITESVTTNKDLVRKSDTFFITAGSNDVRDSSVSDLDAGIEKLIATIKNIQPKANIIFVGYLPSYIDSSCMDIKDENSVRRLHSYHRKSNYAMQDAALRNKLTYIDMFHSPNQVCNPESAFVRIPAHHVSAPLWHTTGAGHQHITNRILSTIKMVP